jgi:hypothetical protein
MIHCAGVFFDMRDDRFLICYIVWSGQPTDRFHLNVVRFKNRWLGSIFRVEGALHLKPPGEGTHPTSVALR